MRKIRDILCVGDIDWDNRLFDELIPLPDGTSYNSYFIRASEKNVLVDTSDLPKKYGFVSKLKQLGIEKIDYVVSHHAEQDHSGAIPEVLKSYPESRVLCTPKCKNLLMDLLLIPEERIITVSDGERVSLGDRNLEFIHAPWVHWPETMFTYLHEENILFSCDLFGSHFATSDVFVRDEPFVRRAAKRYYAEIMMPFRNNIKNHIEKLKKYSIEIIAPSHGPAYDRPEFIIDAYMDWISDSVKNEVVIPYVSMHGTTQEMIDYFVTALIERGIRAFPFWLTKTDIGELAISLVDAATIVVGAPTVLTGPHPAVVYAVYLANLLRPKTKFVSVIGSYGWGGRTVEQIAGMIPNLKVEIIDPVYIKGFPKKEDFVSIDRLADKILDKHKGLQS